MKRFSHQHALNIWYRYTGLLTRVIISKIRVKLPILSLKSSTYIFTTFFPKQKIKRNKRWHSSFFSNIKIVLEKRLREDFIFFTEANSTSTQQSSFIDPHYRLDVPKIICPRAEDGKRARWPPGAGGVGGLGGNTFISTKRSSTCY